MSFLQNTGDQSFSNNADGWALGGGTAVRTLTLTGGNVTITASNSNTYTFPGATSTLSSLGLSETFTANKLFSAGLNVSGGNLVVTGGTFVISGLATNQVLQYNGANIVNAALNSSQLGDFNISSPTANQVIQYNGSQWANASPVDAGGFINKFRNATLDIWSRGTATTAITAGAPAYSADGWIISCTGGNVKWAQGTSLLNTKFSLLLTGTTSVTDTYVKQRIESIDVAPLSGDTVTIQARILNNTGASITPTITVNHCTASDNWAGTASELAATNLQAIPNGSTSVVAYTFALSTSAANGIEIFWDFGSTLNGSTKTINIAEMDVRTTPGIATGTNNNPPPVEFRAQSMEIKQCSRFLPAYAATGTAQPISTGYASSTTSGTYYFQFLTTTRVPVTGITATAGSTFQSEGAGNGVITLTGVSFGKGGPKAATVVGTAASGLVSGPQIMEFATATGSIIFTGAEL